ncbi:LysR family transcriptional regulator [Sediminitomix flava]|uniref:DNA-binding transcriptional LysR family regulator n=1 Tax=Sediminitomix flava TaxID=379075 RepID=A0A315Z8A9_SEDFL|nr:LysR family transcriptional regulator [Sediminitomix flava]PWJ40898.1 DNA-binding transcriptional LysR family regulator [Sediminitomix flava]
MVNLEWYRTFKAIYEKGTLTAAAEALFISQPGVSLHLSSLESYVGYKLFDRSSRKLVPTERGKLLYNSVIDPILKLEEVESMFQRSTEKDTPTISLGMCFETFQFSLEKYLHTFPFNLILQFGGYQDLVSKLEKGVVDLIVTPHLQETKGIIHEPFSKETILLVGSQGVEKAEFDEALKLGQKEVIKWLKEQKWYGVAGDNEHSSRFWQNNFGGAPDFRPNFIVPNINSIVRCLCMGKGLAIIPDFLCKHEIEKGEIQVIWEGKTPISNTLYFAYRKKTIYAKEIEMIQNILTKEMETGN